MRYVVENSAVSDAEKPDLTVELAGVRVGFNIADGSLRSSSIRRYHPYSSRHAPHYRFQVVSAPPAPSRMVRPFRPRVVFSPGEFGFSRGDAKLHLSLTDRTGTLKVWPNPHSFDAALRVLYAGLLTRAQSPSFFLHAAAMLHEGRVLLFPAISGAGKSTLVRTWKTARPLGDELIGVRRRHGGFEAFSTPFWGNGRPPKAPVRGRVRGIFFLERRPAPHLAHLHLAETQQRALKCLLWFPGQDSMTFNRVWGELLALARIVPAYRFSYKLSAFAPADLAAACK